MKAAIFEILAAAAAATIIGIITLSAYQDAIIDDCTNYGDMTVRGERFTCAPAKAKKEPA